MPDDGRSISRNVAHLNILVHDMINLLYYEYWTDKQKYLYVYLLFYVIIFFDVNEFQMAAWADFFCEMVIVNYVSHLLWKWKLFSIKNWNSL